MIPIPYHIDIAFSRGSNDIENFFTTSVTVIKSSIVASRILLQANNVYLFCINHNTLQQHHVFIHTCPKVSQNLFVSMLVILSSHWDKPVKFFRTTVATMNSKSVLLFSIFFELAFAKNFTSSVDTVLGSCDCSIRLCEVAMS